MSQKSNLIVLLNGPPGSGKDTLASELESRGFIHKTFKEPLYDITAFYLDIDECKMRELMERPYKDEYALLKRGVSKTPREWMIHVAETICKKDNKHFFSHLMCEDLLQKDHGKNVVISDLGFKEELDDIKQFCKDHSHEYIVVRMEPDPTFEQVKDSRVYLDEYVSIATLRDMLKI